MWYYELYVYHSINSLPNDKIFDWFKLKAFVDNKVNVNEKFKFGLGRVENIAQKEIMLVTSTFSFSHNVFKSPLFQGHCVVRVKDVIFSPIIIIVFLDYDSKFL